MKISFGIIQDWLLKQKSRQHESLKIYLAELKQKRNYNAVLNKPTNGYDREIKRIEKKLSKIGG